MQKQQAMINELLKDYQAIDELKEMMEASNERIQSLEESYSAA